AATEAQLAGKAGAKAAQADGSPASVRTGGEPTSSTGADRPVPAPASAAQAASPAVGPAIGPQGPAGAAPPFAAALKAAPGGDALTLDQAGSTAGERQAMQAATKPAAATARP